MKQTQIEPKTVSDSHQKNPAKNQMVMRCKVILLKQAIQDAEKMVLKQIGTLSLANIESAVGYLVDAKHTCKIALNDGFMTHDQLCRIMEILIRITSGLRLTPLLDAIQFAVEIHNLMPATEDKRGIPIYSVKNYPVSGGAK